MTDIFHGLILGLIQGITEFFPVSSSGHLILFPVLFGWADQGLAFDTILHLGTLLAVLWVFRVDLWELLHGALVKNNATSKRITLQILVAALPGIILGGLFGNAIESVMRGPLPVAFDLAFWALILFAADRVAAKRSDATRDMAHVSWRQAIAIGMSQALALMPGTSRSGITMTSALLSGLDRQTAVRFSFLVSVPTIAAAGGYGLLKLFTHGMNGTSGAGLFAGFLAAAVAGIWAIRFLKSYVSTHNFNAFVAYRLALALLVVVLIR